MHKIFVIISLVLLLAGSAMFGWLYLEKKKEQKRISRYESKYDSGAAELIEQFGMEGYDKNKLESQIRQEQHDRLQADLDELASGDKNISPFADILYGEDWQDELNKYKKKKEISEFVLTGSIVSVSMGGTIFSLYLLMWLFKSIRNTMSNLKRRSKDTNENVYETNMDEPDETYIERQQQQQSYLKQQSKATWNSYKSNPGEDAIEETFLTKRQLNNIESDRKEVKQDLGKLKDNAEKIAVLLSDEQSTDSLAKLENSLKAQTEKLEERTAENVQKAIMEHSKPIDSTLKDLAQQVSAIREYASCQQERVEKLQDGYDWNIIRTFCLRIIRCIDNLENRISRLAGEGTRTDYLEDVRDELVFALESSGIEQYALEINSDYRGQEKLAEAVKEKEHCDDPNQKGKIAQVIRPGYQYSINDDNVKIVRTAQVKLFD